MGKSTRQRQAEELTKLMEEEPHMERTPIFAQKADSWENGDMGDTYVEVDLTKQHLWMYKEGKLIVESDFVSGTNDTGSCDTARHFPVIL